MVTFLGLEIVTMFHDPSTPPVPWGAYRTSKATAPVCFSGSTTTSPLLGPRSIDLNFASVNGCGAVRCFPNGVQDPVGGKGQGHGREPGKRDAEKGGMSGIQVIGRELLCPEKECSAFPLRSGRKVSGQTDKHWSTFSSHPKSRMDYGWVFWPAKVPLFFFDKREATSGQNSFRRLPAPSLAN